MLKGLYAITNEDIDFDNIEAVLKGGCKVLQYRVKKTPSAQQLKDARSLQKLCHSYKCLFLINDNIALAKEINSDGVHLGQQDSSIENARVLLGEQAIIGITCHNSLGLALVAEQQGASYIAFGAFFNSKTKPQAQRAELELLQQAKQQLSIPIIAIGGITRDNAPLVIERGADMVAVVNDLFASSLSTHKNTDEIEQRAKQFSILFKSLK